MGKATIKPIRKLLIHTKRKFGIKPTFTNVKTNEIEKDIAKDINTAKRTVEYFLLIFISGN
jgi:hypothetical protein